MSNPEDKPQDAELDKEQLDKAAGGRTPAAITKDELKEPVLERVAGGRAKPPITKAFLPEKE